MLNTKACQENINQHFLTDISDHHLNVVGEAVYIHLAFVADHLERVDQELQDGDGEQDVGGGGGCAGTQYDR